MRRKISIVCFSLILVLVAPLLFPMRTANAAFKKSNLIADTVFSNKGSMSASQINSFLNKFGSSCISPNSGFYAKKPIGYNPTDGFSYGSYVRAGSVIAAAAQAYDINPRVLIATLQKEQGLIRGNGPYGCGRLPISASMGYGCPDSGTLHNYSGISLYKRHGTVYTSVNGTCVNAKAKAGFTQQVIRAAWLLKFGQQRSKGNVGWAIIRGNWNNSDDPDTYYAGPMTRGNLKRCSSCSTIYYDGYRTIDGQSVLMGTGGTAALYWYTPHFHGNELFVNIYENWFGSTTVSVRDTPLSGDWNGDGEVTAGIKRGNYYLLDNDNDGRADVTFVYGQPKNKPLVGDWDDNGTDTIALKVGNRYFINNQLSAGTTSHVFSFGEPGNKALAGDWDGNGTDTIALKVGNRYFINNYLESGRTGHVFTYGARKDRPVAGDWSGNNRDTVSLKIGSRFFINNTLHPGTEQIFNYGSAKDRPVAGDWNGNGSDSISLKIGGRFFINNSLAPGTDSIFTFVD
jgi:hypothetical protein